MIVLALGLRRLELLPHREGDIFRAFLISYLAWRFAIDFLKPDVRFCSLTAIQWACNGARNTIVFEADENLQKQLFKVFSTNHSPQSSASTLSDLLRCLPKVELPGGIDYQNLFRVIIMQFIDAESFDVRSIKKTCVHIAHPDGRIIPFDTYNLFYRDDLETGILGPLRAEREVWR